MKIWIFVLITLTLLCFIVYRLLPQSFSDIITTIGKANGSYQRTVFSPACTQLDSSIPSDFLFITVRTTPIKRYSRLKPSLDTWIKDATDLRASDGRKLTKIFVATDKYISSNDQESSNDSYTMFATHCGSSVIQSQGCSVQKELTLFYTEARQARWFCHFDDDAYVNLPALLLLLYSYNYEEPFYIGRRSLPAGIWAWDHVNKTHIKVDFATGEAICLSKRATEMLKPLIIEPKHLWNFLELSRHHPDDITLGYIFQRYLSIPITEPTHMYIQFDDLRNLTEADIRNAVLCRTIHVATSFSLADIMFYETTSTVTLSYGHRNLFLLPNENAIVVAKDSLSKRFHALHVYYNQRITACQGSQEDN